MLEARNNIVILVRDDVRREKSGFILPDSGKVKPHSGNVVSVGDMVQDKKIKKDKKVLFHPTVGWDIEWENVVYTFVDGDKIIASV